MQLERIKYLTDVYSMKCYRQADVAFERGEGVYLYDTNGEKWLDMIAGIAVCVLGHAHPIVTETICREAHKLLHTSNLYYIGNQAELAKVLCENSCLDKAFFCNSGAEANEAAIKLARKYAKSTGHSERYEIITALNSFHGRTLTTVTATGQDKFHKWFTPLPHGFRYVPLNDVHALCNAVTRETCAIMVEPIQGESGIRPATDEYLRTARKLADDGHFLLIFDEVQTGNGRTGKLFAYEHSGIEPDVLTLAKGLANGLPIGACLAKKRACVFAPGDHASTFGGGPFVTAVGLAVQKELLNTGVIANAAHIGEYFKDQLLKIKNTHNVIQEVRGCGLMLGIEFKDEIAGEINAKLFAHKILANSIVDKIIRLLPPLILERSHVEYTISVLNDILSDYK